MADEQTKYVVIDAGHRVIVLDTDGNYICDVAGQLIGSTYYPNGHYAQVVIDTFTERDQLREELILAQKEIERLRKTLRVLASTR